MVLKALVEAITQSLRDPHNLLHLQLVQSLKRDISQDVTEAFTESQPLVDQYPDLYRQSSSFLDFLFRICNAPPPPTPYSEGLELAMCKNKLSEQEKEIRGLLQEKDEIVSGLTEKIRLLEGDLAQKYQALLNLQKELDDCHEDNKQLKCQHHAELEKHSLFFPLPENTTSEGTVSFPPENPPQPLTGLFNVPSLDYPPSDSGEKHWKESQDKLFKFLKNFKKEVVEKFNVSEEKHAKLDQLLKNNFPEKDTTDVVCKSSEPVDDLSNALFTKLEEFLARLLDENQLKESLKLFELDAKFTELAVKLTPLCRSVKGIQFEKVTDEINATQKKVEDVIKNVIQKMSTMYGSKLPSLALTERLDDLEKRLLDKTIELERLVLKWSPSTDIDAQFHESKMAQLEEKIQSKHLELCSKLNETTADFQQEIKTQKEQINGLETKVMTRDNQMLGVNSQIQQFSDQDRRLSVQQPFPALLSYFQTQFPDVGFKTNWEDEVMNYLTDFKNTKEYLKTILEKMYQQPFRDDKLANITFFTVSNLIKTATESTQKLEKVYQKMLDLTDANTQTGMMGSIESADQTFFTWLNENVDRLKTQLNMAQFRLAQGEFSEMQKSLMPTDFDSRRYASYAHIEEMEDGGNLLSIQASSKVENEQLKKEKEHWERKFHDVNLKTRECNENLEKLINQCKRLVGDFHIETFERDMENVMATRLTVYKTYEAYCKSIESKLNIPLSSQWDHLVLQKFTKIQQDKDLLKVEYETQKRLKGVLKQEKAAIELELSKIKSDLVGKENFISQLEKDKCDLEEKYRKNEESMLLIQKTYDDKFKRLKEQLISKDSSQEQSIKISGVSKKRVCGHSGMEDDQEMTKALMKKLFLIFYVRYFETLYKHKWSHLKQIEEETKVELQAKLNILKKIEPKPRGHELTEILIEYVTYESHLLTRNEQERERLKRNLEEVKDIKDLEEFMEFAVTESHKHIRHVLDEYNIQNEEQIDTS